MKRRHGVALGALLLFVMLVSVPPAARAEPDQVDLTHRLQEIYELRAQRLLTEGNLSAIENDYVTGSKTAEWALHHERGKIRYVKQWAENRGVRFVQAQPSIKVKYLKGSADQARFYVGQSLMLGYVYPGETSVNQFGVGTRHVIELRRRGDQWLIGMEWYTDPLGDDTEVPDVTPALVPEPLAPRAADGKPVSGPARRGYDREGALKYADTYCGIAWGCGNENRYNPRYRDYNGVGGDCTNYISQVLRDGGKLNIPIMTRVDSLASHLQYSGRARLMARESFQAAWRRAREQPEGFRTIVREGDLIAYQEKGKLEHFAIVTGADSRGYPLVNTHTADRFHVPFDLGWDRKTVYWFFRMRDP